MQANPLVSIIVPVYNVAAVLERCIDSLLAQTYDNLEIILIDDGSTDGSGELCDLLAGRDYQRIKVLHQENRGLSAARNAGLNIASGSYVTFVDSDDSVQPYLVELLLGLCTQHHTLMSIAGFRELAANSETFPNLDQRAELRSGDPAAWPDDTPTPENVELLTTTACLIRMLCDQGFNVSAWSKLYARELFASVRYPEGKLYEDVGTTYKLVLQCPEIAASSLRPYNYYLNPNSITQRSFSLNKLDLITLTDQMCDDLLAWSKTRDVAERDQLELLTKKRRMHARFSILRQMVMINLKSLPEADRQNLLSNRREIVQYLRSHKQDIFQNPLSSRRDRLAMSTLLLGLPAFRAAWKTYERRKSSSLQ